MLNALSIKARLFWGFGLVILMLAVVAVFSVVAVSGIGATFNGYREEGRIAAQLDSVYRGMSRVRISEFAFRASADPALSETVGTGTRDMLGTASQALASVTEPSRQDEMRAVTRSIEAYASAFADFSRTTTEREALVESVTSLGIEHRRNIGRLHAMLDARGEETFAYRALRASEMFLVTRVRIDRFLDGWPASEFDTAAQPMAETLSVLEALAAAPLAVEEIELGHAGGWPQSHRRDRGDFPRGRGVDGRAHGAGRPDAPGG